MNETRCKIKVFLRYLAFEKFNKTIAQPQLRINTVEAAGTTTSTYVQHSGHFKNKQLVPAKYLWYLFSAGEEKWRKKIPRFKCCANHSRCFVWTKGENNVRWRKIAPKCDKWQKFKRAVINRETLSQQNQIFTLHSICRALFTFQTPKLTYEPARIEINQWNQTLPACTRKKALKVKFAKRFSTRSVFHFIRWQQQLT